ncbi:MAG: DUF6341 family protein, partial [Flavobacterium sp.]|jgi:hypothetical protein
MGVDFLKIVVIMRIFYTFVLVNITLDLKMKAFFEAIQSLFVDFLFLPLDALRQLELEGYWGWWGANFLNWIGIIICGYYVVYWCKQLNLHKENNEDNQDTTAHSFLK